MSGTSINLKDSKISLKINGEEVSKSDGFILVSLGIEESIFSIPRFTAYFSTPVNSTKFYIPDIDVSMSILTSEGKNFNVTYSGTVTSYKVNRIDGVLIPKEGYYERRSSSFENQTIDDILKSLRITSSSGNISTDSKIQGENTFFQINETDWQFASRLLDLTGSQYLWALTEDKVKLIPIDVTNPKEFVIGQYSDLSMNSTHISKHNYPQSYDGINNFYYGLSNVCKPSISDYPNECLMSLAMKGKYKKWSNVSLTKTVPIKIDGLSIGDHLKLKWESDTLIDFIVTGIAYVLSQAGNQFTYTFTNYSGWDPAGVNE